VNRCQLGLLVLWVLAGGEMAWAQASGTDLYEMNILDGLPSGPVHNLTRRIGYDNQPSFLPDGHRLRYTAIDGSGQADIWELDLRDHARVRLTGPPASEYSALQVPGLDRFSVVRVEADSTQRLWSFDADGTDPRLELPDRPKVGYHCWLDAQRLVLFVLGDPHELHRARLGAPGSRVVATGIGRCLQAIPGESAWSFTRVSPAEICRLDAADDRVETIAPLPEPSIQDYCWLPDGRLWCSDGTRILEWRTGGVGSWEVLVDLAARGIDSITRMAVSPSGETLVFVASDQPPAGQ
jgi:hypothetical protein